jgi:hypothetical protein
MNEELNKEYNCGNCLFQSQNKCWCMVNGRDGDDVDSNYKCDFYEFDPKY